MDSSWRNLGLAVLLAGTALAIAAPSSDPPGGTPAAPAAATGPGRGPGGRHLDPAQMTGRMTSSLGLSATQSATVLRINEQFAAKTEDLRQRSGASRMQYREQMRSLFEERNAELRKVLDDEQYRQLLDQQQQMRERRREHRQDPKPGSAGSGAAPAPSGPPAAR